MAESISQTKRHGEVCTFYQYIETDYDKEGEPCLCIGNNSRLAQKRRAWVIPLSEAHRYADSMSGGPTADLVETTIKISQMLHLAPSRQLYFKLVDIILDAIPELLRMPPRPPEDARAKIENAVERQGLKINVDGESIVG